MKRLVILLLLLLPLVAAAQTQKLIEIDAGSFGPVQTDAISGIAIDRIAKDPSQRPCARIKMHINRMTRDEIEGVSVRIIGGNVVLTKQIVAVEGNGLIIEMTAKQPVRFYLHHDKYGDSNEVALNLEGDKEYKIQAVLNTLHTIVVNSNSVGADVYVDNVYKGVIGNDFSLTIGDTTPGVHKIKVQNGTLISEKEVTVSSTSIFFRIDINQETARPQYVVLQVEPKGANVVIDGKNYVPDQFGMVQVLLNNGSYQYSISAKSYHEERGTFIINGEKITKTIKLQPNFGWVKVPGQGALEGASVYIDDALIGQAPVTSKNIPSGTHTIRIVKQMYKTFEEQIMVKDNAILEFAPSLIADFANISLKTETGCTIYVNGERKGTAAWSGKLATGTYIFESRKDGHRTAMLTKDISAVPENQSYIIPAPTPIFGSIHIKSTPAMADIYIDGVKLNDQTPMMKEEIVGEHTITIRKEGFSDFSKRVTISEGKMEEVVADLTEKRAEVVPATTDGSNIILYTSTNDLVVDPYNRASFGEAKIVSNTYRNGQGIITFDRVVTTIGSMAFYYRSNLASITIPEGVTSIGYAAFSRCYTMSAVSIPTSVTTIGSQAFQDCSSLISVAIPASVSSIGSLAFSGCTSLKSVYCKRTTPPAGGSNMFDKNAYDRKIYVPGSAVSSYKNAAYWYAYNSDIVGTIEKTPSKVNNYTSSTTTSSTAATASKAVVVRYYTSNVDVYVDGVYKGTSGSKFYVKPGEHYYIVVKSGSHYYGKKVWISSYGSSEVVDMNSAPRVQSIWESSSSTSKSSYSGSTSTSGYKKSKSWDSFNLGLFADVAFTAYDYSLFSMGVGLNWRLWKYNSICIPTIGARYMYGFGGSQSVGFPIIVNLNWWRIFSKKASVYFGIGAEPIYMQNCWITSDEYGEPIYATGWDCQVVVNLFGVGGRHHDFNIYMNMSPIIGDLSLGCRYTYLF